MSYKILYKIPVSEPGVYCVPVIQILLPRVLIID